MIDLQRNYHSQKNPNMAETNNYRPHGVGSEARSGHPDQPAHNEQHNHRPADAWRDFCVLDFESLPNSPV